MERWDEGRHRTLPKVQQPIAFPSSHPKEMQKGLYPATPRCSLCPRLDSPALALAAKRVREVARSRDSS